MRLTVPLAIVATTAPLLGGCGGVATDGPSYADLVVTYNAELQTLDRLERKRAELVADFERQLAPDAEDAVKALTDVLNSAGGTGGLDAQGEPLTPDRALDLAVENAERTGQAASQLLEAAQSGQAPRGELTPEQMKLKEAFETELAELDKEIAEQKARVDRARQARDSAQ